MPVAAYSFSCFMGVFSVLLMGWNGYQDYAAGWVFGLLAVVWSLLMMSRLMTLSVPYESVFARQTLAHKILHHFHLRREEHRRLILTGALGGSYPVFVLAVFLFLGWQIYCTLNPSEKTILQSMAQTMTDVDASITMGFQILYAQAQTIMMVLFSCVVAFVFRSHAQNKQITRPLMIILAGYAASGLIAFYGLPDAGAGALAQAAWGGSGAGAGQWLSFGQNPTLFDIVLFETGAVGLAILAFALFVPLGAMTLQTQDGGADLVVLSCAMIVAMCLILSLFLTLTPALGAYITMCLMGIFAAWGAIESPAQTSRFARA